MVEAALLAPVFTVLVAFIVHRAIYPKVTGTLHIAGIEWSYRIGRILFYNAGTVYLWMYRGWVEIDRIESLQRLSKTPLTIHHMSVWQHVRDSHVIYPAILTMSYLGLAFIFTEFTYVVDI